jgi:hypothetical protein
MTAVGPMVRFQPHKFFFTHKELNFTLVAVEGNE